MKLAEALIERADAQKRLAQLRDRATSVARFQEGEQPAEDAAELLAAGRQLTADIERLIAAVNRTNSATELEPGVTITDALAQRDALAMRRRLVTEVADAAAGNDDGRWGRQLRSELRYVTPVPVADLRREADDLAKQFRELDTRLQAANWTVELIEG
jgi:hypothetical protein